MKLKEFVGIMEKIAPRSLAADFDNPGLLIDGDGRDIKRVLVALDCTDAVAREAVEGKFDLVLTHHPLIFNPVKQILSTESVTSVVHTLIRHGIAFFCAHTNLDIADGGVNDVLAEMYGLENVVKVEPENYGRVGDLPHEMTLVEFTELTDKLLNTVSKTAVADYRKDPENIVVRRVGVLGGAGGDDIEIMKKYGVDVFVTGEIKHNRAIDAQHYGLNVVQAGHYETEKVVLLPLIAYLQNTSFGVEYKLTECEQSSLRIIRKDI